MEAATAHAKTLQFLGVVTGPDDVVDDERVGATATKWGLNYPTVRDRDAALAKRFGVKGSPTIIVLGPGQKVLFTGHRVPKDWAALSQ